MTRIALAYFAVTGQHSGNFRMTEPLKMRCPYDGAEIICVPAGEKVPAASGEWYRCCGDARHYFKAEQRAGKTLLVDMAENVIGELRRSEFRKFCGTPPPISP